MRSVVAVCRVVGGTVFHVHCRVGYGHWSVCAAARTVSGARLLRMVRANRSSVCEVVGLPRKTRAMCPGVELVHRVAVLPIRTERRCGRVRLRRSGVYVVGQLAHGCRVNVHGHVRCRHLLGSHTVRRVITLGLRWHVI